MANIVNRQPVGLIPAGYQQLTVGTEVVALTVPTGTVRALFSVEGDTIRYRNDGIDPTSSVGFQVAVNANFELYGNINLKALKLIRSGSNNATVNVIYYKE